MLTARGTLTTDRSRWDGYVDSLPTTVVIPVALRPCGHAAPGYVGWPALSAAMSSGTFPMNRALAIGLL
jgi:hypothetical protein